VTGYYRKLHNEELHNSNTLQQLFLKLSYHGRLYGQDIYHTCGDKNVNTFFAGKPEKSGDSYDLEIDGRIIHLTEIG
jgi:hypothetical protein